jgi:hypothetical protein
MKHNPVELISDIGIDGEKAKANLVNRISQGIVKYHPDTENTFAAFEIQFGGNSIWLNARNGEIISMGRTINSLIR